MMKNPPAGLIWFELFFLILFFSFLQGQTFAQDLTKEEERKLQEAFVPQNEFENYRQLYGNEKNVDVDLVIRNYQMGFRIENFFSGELSQPSMIKMNREIFSWAEERTEQKNKKDDFFIGMENVSVSPKLLQQFKEQFIQDPQSLVDLGPLADFTEESEGEKLRELRDSLVQIDPDCMELVKQEMKQDLKGSGLGELCQRVAAGKIPPAEVFQLAGMGVKTDFLIKNEEQKKEFLHFLREKGLGGTSGSLVATLLNHLTVLKALSDEEIILISRHFQENGLFHETDLGLESQPFADMVRHLKNSPLKEFPLSVSLPIIGTYFQNVAKSCLNPILSGSSEILAIHEALTHDHFKNHIDKILEIFDQTLIRPGDTLVHIGHSPEEALGKNRGGKFTDSWDPLPIMEIGKKLGSPVHFFRPGKEAKTSDKISDGMNFIGQTKGPMTIFLYGHGSTEGTVCIEGRKTPSAKVNVERLVEALILKKSQDRGDSPVTLVIHSCHAQRIGEVFLQKWKAKSQEGEAPFVVTTAGGVWKEGKMQSLPMLRESVRSFKALASLTTPLGIRGIDFLKTLGRINFDLNSPNHSNNLGILTLCPVSTNGCQELNRY